MTRRILRDYKKLVEEGPENGIWIKTASGSSVLDSGDDMSKFYVMVLGPDGPYKGSLFFFSLEPFTQFVQKNDGKSYPVHPPKVLHISPFSFRSHPNLYQGMNAKVCLSILGTWAGPSWTPMMSFMTIFQTVLSILDNSPLQNEPGFTNKPNDPRVAAYTQHVQFACLLETVMKTFKPVLSNSTHTCDPARLFQDEITTLWIEKGHEYIATMKQLDHQYKNQRVPGTVYGTDSYSGKPYSFAPALTAMQPYIAESQQYTAQIWRKQKLKSSQQISLPVMERTDTIHTTKAGKITKTSIHPACSEIEFKQDSVSVLVEKQALLSCYKPASSNAQRVSDWTRDTGAVIADKPTAMTRSEVQFIINMASSELVELAQTVADNPDDAVKMVQQGARVDLTRDYTRPTDELEIISEQADAAVDVMYYLYNTYAKKRINLDSVFEIVHAANEAKRHADGTFHHRDDGKVLKPTGWKSPDIKAEIQRQMRQEES